MQKSSKNYKETFERLATQNRPDNNPASTHALVSPKMENVNDNGEQRLKKDEHKSKAEPLTIVGQDHTSSWAEPSMVIDLMDSNLGQDIDLTQSGVNPD